ncbi:helix-turn-helix domain-containing protein [Portibacter marinus]|uniref:helix-turn-helix domain-containing protein n=1 Tax=Portibacter marinus TaxID=2898660 RepID=UPI001F18E67D|nr:AraC family transcriptional regulator [Portibacter marinus]
MDYKSVSLFILFLHNLLFAGLLVWHGRKNNLRSNYWLASFLFLAALYIVPFVLGYAGWYAVEWKRNILFYFPFQQLFLLPPVLYMYTKSLLEPKFTFKKIDLVYFIPAILYSFYTFIVWITDQVILGEYYFYDDGKDMDFDPWYQFAGFIYLLFFAALCIKAYLRYRNNTFQIYSYADAILYIWLPRFIIALILLLLIRLCFFITNPEWANFGQKYWYYVSFSILTYYISINGYIHAVKLVPISWRNLKLAASEREDKPEYADQSNEGDLDLALKDSLVRLMEEEQFFSKPDLTLYDLANELDVHSRSISQTINMGFDMNFNDYVNMHRTKEVMKRMQTEDLGVKSILGIAYDCGFNSKSTFNRAFKKYSNMTPSKYLASIRKK